MKLAILIAAVDASVGAVPRRPHAQRSLSALTWAVRARATGFPLVRRNVFFDRDYRSGFDEVFRTRRLPRRGTVYVCAQDRGDGAAAPAGAERLVCLVNAPADGDRRAFTPSETDPCEFQSLALLRDWGLPLVVRRRRQP